MTCLCPSNTLQTPSSYAPSQWQVSCFQDHTLSSVQRPAGQWPAEMKNSLSDWETSSLLSVSQGPEWADLVGSRHNKHFSKWTSSDDKLGHIECPSVFSGPSAWWCRPTKTVQAEERAKSRVLRNRARQRCFWASHTQLDSSCCKDLHWIHPKSLCCHFSFRLTYGIMHRNVCGYRTYSISWACPSTCMLSPIIN